MNEVTEQVQAECSAAVQTQPEMGQEEISTEVPIKRRFGIPGRWRRMKFEESPETPKRMPKNEAAPIIGVPDRWVARGFQDAMKGSAEKPQWIVEDLLLAESATLVSAQPHAMKSLSLLSACLEAVTMKVVWGHFAAKNVDSVLFLETEDPPWMVESRIRGLAKGLGLDERPR